MIDIIFNHTVFHPTLRQEFLNMAYDCRQDCYPMNPTGNLAGQIKNWFKNWFESQELACKIHRPLPDRESESIPTVEQMFQMMLIEAITEIDYPSWMQLASWWLRELEKSEQEAREKFLRGK